MQSLSGLFRNLNHPLRLPLPSFLECRTGRHSIPLMPSRFHQHSPHTVIARLGNRSITSLLQIGYTLRAILNIRQVLFEDQAFYGVLKFQTSQPLMVALGPGSTLVIYVAATQHKL